MHIRRIINHGFTLLEVLLAISIISIIVATIMSIFWSGISLSQRGSYDVSMFQEVQQSFDLIQSDLENMINYDFSNSYPEKVSFEGSSQQISMIVPSDEGLKYIEYSLESTKPSGSIYKVILGKRYQKNESVSNVSIQEKRQDMLIRREIPFVEAVENKDAQGALEIIADHVLEDGLKFSFGYFDNDQSRNISWKDKWQDKNWPSVVKVEINFLFSAGKQQQVKRMIREMTIPIKR